MIFKVSVQAGADDEKICIFNNFDKAKMCLTSTIEELLKDWDYVIIERRNNEV